MNETLRQALDAFRADTEKTEKAEQAISTLTSCFGEPFIDVHRYEPIEVNPDYDSRLRSLLQSSQPEEERVRTVLNYIERCTPFWSIVIKFPHEVVFNEYGNKVDIYDFFVRVIIKKNGNYYGIQAIKATFTEDQLYSGYVHSHCPHLNRSLTGIKEWKSMCFGSGPILQTMRAMQYDGFDAGLWIAFASELRQWVRTESTDGGPYFRLASISQSYTKVINAVPKKPTENEMPWVMALTRSYIRAKRIKIGFLANRFYLGTSFVDWLMDFSKYASAWGTKNNITIPVQDTLVRDGQICEKSSDRSTNFNNLVGQPVLTFKGEDVKLKVIKGTPVEHFKLFPYQLGLYIITTILDTLNTYANNTDSRTVTIQWGK